MNERSQPPRNIAILRRVARIWGGLSAAFMLFFILGHLFGDESSGTPNVAETIGLAFFPLGLMIGLIVAYWKEFTGGIIATGCIIGFHITMLIAGGNPDFNPFIDGLAVPGVLYLVAWYLARKAQISES